MTSRVRKGIPGLSIGWMLLIAAGFAGEDFFDIIPTVDKPALGERIDIILRARDLKFDPSRIEKVQFEEGQPAEAWHVAEAWKPVLPEKRTTPGWLWKASVQGFEAGESTLPATRVFFRFEDGAASSTLIHDAKIVLRSNLPAEEEPGEAATGPGATYPARPPKKGRGELYGLRPLHEFPGDWRWTAAGVAAGLIAAGLLFAAVRRYLRRRRVPAEVKPSEPPLPPGVWALREIHRQRSASDAGHRPAKTVAGLTSEIIRTYLGRRFDFLALDMTTFECMRVLRDGRAEPHVCDAVQKFLGYCDLIKFSKFDPPAEALEALWDDARGIVLNSTPAAELTQTTDEAASELAGVAAR